MRAIELQDKIASALNTVFEDVIIEWNSAKDTQDELTRDFYCPRVDIAVGPFGTTGRTDTRIKKHAESAKRFVESLRKKGFSLSNSDTNENPRCLFAIEIELSGSRKHMLGDVANASILGDVGIIIVSDQKKFEQFEKLLKFIDFANRHNKLQNVFRNVIIIKATDFLDSIDTQYPRRDIISFIKFKNAKWQLRNNDKDPYPSNPHLHDLKSGNKLNPYTGEIYNANRSRIVSRLKEKDLTALLDQYTKAQGKDIREIMRTTTNHQ